MGRRNTISDVNTISSVLGTEFKIVTRHDIRINSIYAPLWKRRAYCFAPAGRYVGRSVGMSVALHLVQLITKERFAP